MAKSTAPSRPSPAARLQAASRSVTAKLAAISVLILLLLIPKSMVMDLIRERQQRQREAKSEISGKWGGSQTFYGPFLTVPYETLATVTRDKKEVTTLEVTNAVFLPETLEISAQVDPQIRYRGIFEAVLFQAGLKTRARFAKPSFSSLSVKPHRILWDKAAVVYGITDIRGIQKDARLSRGGRALALNPGSTDSTLAGSGVHTGLDLNLDAPLEFEFNLTLNGAESLWFVPAGRMNRADVKSSWASPSFQGAFLPTRRELSPAGFTASWEVPHLARNFPQQWIHAAYEERDLREYAFGVDLLQPVNAYTTTTRSAKYGVLFIVLTFLVFFLFEVLSSIRVHAVQYLLIGFALLLFYVLLLALSEQMAFGWAYLLAAAATVALVTAYGATVVRDKNRAWTVGLVLAFVYAYLYCLLKAEDYALLLGSIGLFLALGVVMYATRKVDWYATASKTADKG